MSYNVKEATTTYTLPLKSLERSKRGAALKRRTSAQLVLASGPHHIKTQKLYPIKDRVILGRKPSADIYINDKKLSRLHAQILFDGRHYTIKDLNSTNGTKVNGRYITEKRIQPGDTVEIGNLTFEFNRQQIIQKNKKQQKGSFLTKFFDTMKIIILGSIILVCAALIYYSATKPFNEKRAPQSIQGRSAKITETTQWVHTQSALFYEMANQAYNKGEYHQAKHFLIEAAKLSDDDKYAKLHRAIGEAIVIKRLYLDKIKSKDERAIIQKKVLSYLEEATKYSDIKEWDLAIIAYQEALLLDSTSIDAKHGIENVEKLRAKSLTPVKQRAATPNTLKQYEHVETLTAKAQSLVEKEQYAAALYEYKQAITVAKKAGLSLNSLLLEMTDVANQLKDKTKSMWNEMELLIEADRLLDAKANVEKILIMNPHFSQAIQKKKEIEAILTVKAKHHFSQAVIYEALPDIAAAKIEWNEVLTLVENSHPYYLKAKSKLTRYTSF